MKAIDWLLVCAVLVFVFGGGGGLQLQPDKAVIVYESAEYTVPPFIADTLQQSGIDARVVDQHVVTGEGKTPADVAPAIEAAKKNGLPRLVLMRGNKVAGCYAVPQNENELKELLGD
jgi:hypothetical protein